MKSYPLLMTLLLTATLFAQEPAPNPVRLVYEMPVDALQRSLKGRPEMDLEQLLAESIGNVQARVPEGVKVARSEATRFTVDLPDATRAALELVRASIETVGKFEMRMIADADYSAPGVTFDMPKERERLQAWLDDGGRDKLRQDTAVLAEFHADKKGGPIAGANLRWFVRRIGPNPEAKLRWDMRFADVPALRAASVAAYTEADWNDGSIPPRLQNQPASFLIELVAVNMHETYFATRDIDPKHTKPTKGWAGNGAVAYRLVPARAGEYADWTEKYIGKCCAMLWEDEVLAAPRFESRIPGLGQITGVTVLESREMARTMRAPLVAKPVLLRMEPR